jgi:hypothetical protein
MIMRHKTDNSQRGQADTATFRLAQGLGIFSILLGVSELIWGKRLGRSLGLDRKEEIVRAYGAREILSGVPILVSKDPTPWIWLRVAGDALDAGTLIGGYKRRPQDASGILTAFLALTPVMIADLYCAISLSRESKKPLSPVKDYSDRSGFPRGTPMRMESAR